MPCASLWPPPSPLDWFGEPCTPNLLVFMTTSATPRVALRWLFLAALLLVGFGAYRVVAADGPVADPTPAAVAVPSHLGSVAGAVAAQAVSPGIVADPPSNTDSPPAAVDGLALVEPSTTTTVLPTTSVLPSTTVPASTTTVPVTTTSEPPPTTTLPPTTTTHVHPTTTTTVPSTTTTTVATTTTTTPPPSSGVLSEDEARDLFGLYFPADEVETALRVAICESSLNPSAYNPAGYGGLFQHSLEYWPSRAEAAGWAGASVYDPHANSAVAAWLQSQSGWAPWPNC